MPEYYPSIGDAIGSAMAHNARMAARHHADRATEDEQQQAADNQPASKETSS